MTFRAARPQRRAYTLVEVAVAFMVAVLVIGIAWSLWRMAERSFHSSRKRLTSLQGAFLLMERFCHDMRQAYVDPAHPLTVTDQARLDFNFFDLEASALKPGEVAPVIQTRTMAYRHDKDSGVFSWKDGPAAERPVKTAPFECILFHSPTLAVPPALPRAQDQYVTFRITCASEDDFDANRGKGDLAVDRRTKEVVTIITAVGLEQAAGEAAFPWWKKNRVPEVR